MAESERSANLRQFLLGQLPEESRVRVEAEFFADDAEFEHLLALEDELMYEYLQGVLRGPEREAFERRFTAATHSKREFAEALIELTSGSATSPAPVPIRRPGWLLAAAAAIAIAVGLPVWQMQQTNRLRSELGVLQRQLATQPAAVSAPAIVSLIVRPGMVRGAEEPTRLRIPGGDALLRLQLDLRPNSHYQQYRATVRTAAGVDVFSQDLAPIGRSLVLTVPAAAVRPGPYRIAVQGSAPGGAFEDDADYFFTAVN